MPNEERNSISSAGRVADLTNNPGNGLSQQILRNDVTRRHDWPSDENREPIMPVPVSAMYYVNSNNMEINTREAIFMKDQLYAETISLEKAIPGKVYIITDLSGNTYLAKIEEINPGQSLRLHSLNPAFKDIFLRRSEIQSLAIVFRQDTQIMSQEMMVELFDFENENGKDLIHE